MTARTRGRLMMCLILGLITLPVEALILPIARTPDTNAAAKAYVADLSPADLNAAASDITAYPAPYRKAIMSELSPERRAEIWRAHLQAFLTSHRDLTQAQAAVVREAMAVVTPAALSPDVTAPIRERMAQVFNAAMTELGAQTAGELFVTLGPKAVTRNALPLTQRLADQVRSWRTASAQEAPPCVCNMTWDTCDLVPDPWLVCTQIYDCIPDTTWPMCGPFFAWACDGWCRMTRTPGGGGGGGS